MSSIQWLYKYVFRGLGLVIVATALFIVYLEISARIDRPDPSAAKAAGSGVDRPCR